MSSESSPLEPLSFPLTGSRLIEASAGTGKTFTIAALYVRLVLGHGGGNAFLQGRPLTPPEILVVTFTDAATKELRDRIRARLAEAADYFREAPETVDSRPAGEDFLFDLRQEYEPEQWPVCACRLQRASEWMDEAAVSTIHSWCNRMLREHAFDSQSLFTQNLETDQSELLSEIVCDYWRNFFYPLDTEDFVTVLKFWSSPDALEREIKALLAHAELLESNAPPQDYLPDVRKRKKIMLERLKAPWLVWAPEIKALLDDAKQKKLINGRKLRADWYASWLEKLLSWAADPDSDWPDLSASAWSRLTPQGMADAWNNDQPPSHPGFDAMLSLPEALAELPTPRSGILRHAVHWVAERFAAVQNQRAQMGFNDLLTALEAALLGNNGDRLAEVIRYQFPVALIDEFQDTDPVQCRIFERIYRIEQNREDCSLILIGDPKQAIYAFRGADIYTYLEAREAVQDRLYTLSTNFRSTQAMVDAVNHCFEFSERQPESPGAFLFRRGNNNPVPFHAVQAKGRTERFVAGGQAVPALTAAVLAAEKNLSKGCYLEQMSEICATRIVDWLNQGQRQRAGFVGHDGQLRHIKPNDIAVLVNNGKEAASIRWSLSCRGVRSVYLSDKDSVYESLQALEIFRWLSACAEPDNDRLLRAALSTATLGLSLAELEALNHDEEVWENRVLQFKEYRDIWQRQGVLPMLRNILYDFTCVDRLLQLSADITGVSGERLLTDLMHLAELLQQASHGLEGEHALIRFLAEQIASPSGDIDAKKVRLESDADLVKVVTVHKSKGLEYPVVFLPFICATRQIKADDMPLKWHNDENELRISLEAGQEVLQRADRDRLGEDVRKVYVALTRARFATWLGLAPLEKSESSAVGHLFGIGNAPSEQLLNEVHRFAEKQSAIAVESELIADNACFVPADADAVAGQARVPVRSAKESWQIASYSSLRTDNRIIVESRSVSVNDETAQAANLQEAELDSGIEQGYETRLLKNRHGFPKGAEAGTFLHELMEWAAGIGFSDVLASLDILRDEIIRRCRLRRWEIWAEPLHEWIRAMIETPLPTVGEDENNPVRFAFQDLQIYSAEMEFWFETHGVDLEQLDALVNLHTLEQRPRPKLLAENLNGMLKGFIDLIFEYQGKYYVADYKSNWLGHQDCDYSQSAMRDAVLSHRYDLQYVIYLFALHRLLKSRLPNYDYDSHVGGAIYLFMRGIRAETAGVHFERPGKALIESLDTLFSGNGESWA